MENLLTIAVSRPHVIPFDDWSYELKIGEWAGEEKSFIPIQDNNKDGGKKGCAVLLAAILFIVYLLLA